MIQWCPQRLASSDWEKERFPDIAEAIYWGERSCGAACAQSVLAHFTNHRHPLFEIIADAVNTGAYSDRGWIHARLAAYLVRVGVPATAKAWDTDVDRWTNSFDADSILIASVGLGFPDDGRKGGHLVIAHGFEQRADHKIFKIMDPADWGDQIKEIEVMRFFASFAGRVIECMRPAPLTKKSVGLLR